jgi:hypothetical protein
MPKLKKSAASGPEPADDVPVHDERPPLHCDPGSWVPPEPISACIERIFVDLSKRLDHETRHT